MTDTTTNGSGKTRATISKRDWLNAQRERVPTGSADVAGIRYTFLANNKSVEFMFADSQRLTYQFAAMGGLTKFGNEVNSIVNADDYDSSDPMDSVAEWLQDAIDGNWREEGEGVARGPKYDNAILADVLAGLAAAQGKTVPAADYLAKIVGVDGDKESLSAARKAKALFVSYDAVKDAYKAEAAKRGIAPKAPAKPLGDLL